MLKGDGTMAWKDRWRMPVERFAKEDRVCQLPGRDEEIMGCKKSVCQPRILLKSELAYRSVIISFYTFLLHLLYWFHKKVISVMTTYDKPLSKETCLVYRRGSWMIFMRKHSISMRFVLADNQGRALLFGVRNKKKKKKWGK